MWEDASIKTWHCKNFALHRHRQKEVWNSNGDSSLKKRPLKNKWESTRSHDWESLCSVDCSLFSRLHVLEWSYGCSPFFYFCNLICTSQIADF